MSTAAVFPPLERSSLECGKRHPRMSEAVFKAVNAKKTKVVEVLERGREEGKDWKDPKSTFNECAPVVLGRTLEKSDFAYLEVTDQGNDSGNSGCFRCKLELRGQTFTHVFRPGEPGKSRKDGERNAAAAALDELQEILRISTAAAPEVPEKNSDSGVTCDDAGPTPRKDSATWRCSNRFVGGGNSNIFGIFTPIPGEMSQIDYSNIFQMGCNML